jgi:alcohol dehydrogenase
MIPAYYEFYFPVKILSGHRSLSHLPNELRALGARRPMLLTDAGVKGAGLVRIVLNALKESEVTVGALFDQVPSESSTGIVNALAALWREKGCDSLIAVGGGSVIDTAKGVNLLVSKGGEDIRAYLGADILDRPLGPLIVVPTTAGTGSEATGAAVIVDDATHVKLSFISQYLLPNAAFLDSRMTFTLPPKLTAATGMDALTHAMEAMLSLQKNPMSDAYAFEAIRLIGAKLPAVVDRPGDKDLRLALANASTMAGAAFSNAMVGAVHSLGHAAGAVGRIPHGTAMNIFLPHGLRFNLDARRDVIGEMLLPFAGPAVYAATPEDERAEELIAQVEALRKELHRQTGLPMTLRQAGVRRDQFDEIARLAIDDGSAVMNPVELGREDARAMLEAAYA